MSTTTVPTKLLEDAYAAIDDLMPGIGRLALSADQIRRLNETLIGLKRATAKPAPRTAA
jgi:hypothetical protein